MLVQNNFLEGYRDYAVDAGNSHMRFYDVTSWSYVNLDDPVLKLEPSPLRLPTLHSGAVLVGISNCLPSCLRSPVEKLPTR